jgi:hypothetical protein
METLERDTLQMLPQSSLWLQQNQNLGVRHVRSHTSGLGLLHKDSYTKYFDWWKEWGIPEYLILIYLLAICQEL